MVTATAIRIGVSDGKPTDLGRIIELLVRGAGDQKGEDESDSDYITEKWWGDSTAGDDDEGDVDGGR